MCGIWSWLVCGIRSGWCAGFGVAGVRDLEWLVCGIWSWSGWCEGLLGDLRGWVVCAGLGLDGVWD